jgi:hypothetical protein
MKAFPLMVIVISISLICALNFSLVSALGSDEASVSLLWLSPAVTNGDIVAVRMTLTSNSPDLLRIFRIGFHFDWMASNEYYTIDFSSNPMYIPSSASQVFDDLSIEIPFNVTVGDHSYFVAVEGTEGLLTQEIFSWESSAFTIKIQPIAAKIYSELKSEVETKVSNAYAANYKNSEAQSLLQQAQTQYDTAVGLAYQEEWINALISLENATSYLDQAKLAEERGADQSLELQNLLFYLAIIAVVVIVVVLIIVVVRKRRKQPAEVVDQPVDQSFDEQMETQDYTPEE